VSPEPDRLPDPIRQLRHDIANPLAALLAETQLLLLNANRLDPETVDGLHEIEALARRMRDILTAFSHSA
jgi:signal transduction histidine kinase